MATHAISFHGYFNLNGLPQWVTMCGQSRANPLLLVIHGGPGSTYSKFTSATCQFATQFTVVHWDQRGAGKTYQKNKVVPHRLQDLVQDGVQLTRRLKRQFPNTPIILWGSSIGSLTANLMVQQAPNLFALYLASEQMTPTTHQFAFNQAMADTKRWGIAKNWLQQLPFNAHDWTAKQLNQFNIYCGLQRTDVANMVFDLFLKTMVQAPDYRIRDIIAFASGMIASYQALHQELDHFNYERLFTQLPIPVIIFQGAHDPITPTVAIRQYFNQIQAPMKKLIIVPQTGHLCLFANPQFFLSYADLLKSSLSKTRAQT
ncbi:alpha/beta fold hydrolase [Pediococcus siamensis]|uniref:alpha/beta fold hydrolase n=1 Tax=Pediococcus siamensis TaxID=381829 RepID=UPI0039A1BCE8